MQVSESSGFLDFITSLDPPVLAAIVAMIIMWLVVRIRSGAALDPFDMFRGTDDDEGPGTYTLEDFRKDYNPDDKWNRAPTNHDRL